MDTIHPQYIKDSSGKNMVVLSQSEFDFLLEKLEEMEDIKLFDQAKKEDDGERIPADEVFTIIESKRKK